MSNQPSSPIAMTPEALRQLADKCDSCMTANVVVSQILREAAAALRALATPQEGPQTQSVDSGGPTISVNLDARWEALRARLVNLTSDGKTAGIVDETDVLAMMREMDVAQTEGTR